MASFMRLAARQGCRLLASQPVRNPRFIQPVSFLSTSKKKTDAASVSETINKSPSTEENFADKEENWISYGYDLVDRSMDEWSHFMYLFLGVTVCICWGGFVLAYQPDHRLKDWAQREAYLELARREKEGLPLVDGDLVPSDQIELPSDEELGEFEIIV